MDVADRRRNSPVVRLRPGTPVRRRRAPRDRHRGHGGSRRARPARRHGHVRGRRSRLRLVDRDPHRRRLLGHADAARLDRRRTWVDRRGGLIRCNRRAGRVGAPRRAHRCAGSGIRRPCEPAPGAYGRAAAAPGRCSSAGGAGHAAGPRRRRGAGCARPGKGCAGTGAEDRTGRGTGRPSFRHRRSPGRHRQPASGARGHATCCGGASRVHTGNVGHAAHRRACRADAPPLGGSRPGDPRRPAPAPWLQAPPRGSSSVSRLRSGARVERSPRVPARVAPRGAACRLRPPDRAQGRAYHGSSCAST